MATSNIKEIINSDIHNVWKTVTNINDYSIWRSDIQKTKIINDHKFIEYTRNGFATTFTITNVEPYKRLEFNMENENIIGNWTGIFYSEGNKTKIDFTENVKPKKFFMKPFVKLYLKNQQRKFVYDLRQLLEK